HARQGHPICPWRCAVRSKCGDAPMTPISKNVRVPDLAEMKERGERIVMLAAYDATMTRLFDRAGIDLLLVGDSLSNVILGLDTTIPVTLEEIIHHKNYADDVRQGAFPQPAVTRLDRVPVLLAQ